MTQEELYQILDLWEHIEIYCKRISQNPEEFNVLMSLALNHPKQKSWRAAYLVDKIHDKNPEIVKPYLPSIVEQLKHETNASKRRHWLKLISMNTIDRKYFGFLFDYCIETFTSSKEAIAVRVHAMQILYNISESEPDLKPELLEIIEHEVKYHSSAGIRSRGGKLLRKLSIQTSQ